MSSDTVATMQSCAECGKPVRVCRWQRARGRGKFCSPVCHYKSRTSTPFWDNVDKTSECWVWIAGKNGHGYGEYREKNTAYSAHRYAYETTYGTIPRGLFVCHRCDNRACVRPDHLFLGTCGDNLRDAAQKGRMTRGEKMYNSKMTEALVREARRLFANGWGKKAIAQHLGITYSIVHDVVRRATWRHVA